MRARRWRERKVERGIGGGRGRGRRGRRGGWEGGQEGGREGHMREIETLTEYTDYGNQLISCEIQNIFL